MRRRQHRVAATAGREGADQAVAAEEEAPPRSTPAPLDAEALASEDAAQRALAEAWLLEHQEVLQAAKRGQSLASMQSEAWASVHDIELEPPPPPHHPPLVVPSPPPPASPAPSPLPAAAATQTGNGAGGAAAAAAAGAAGPEAKPLPAGSAAAAALGPAALEVPHQPWAWKGIKLRAAAAAVGLGLAVRFLVPIPEGVDEQAWSLLGFFMTTVAGLVLEPAPAGAWALMCCALALVSHCITFEEAFAASDSQVLWLIVTSFFIARGFEQTGLGERIAQMLVRAFGGSTRSLALSLAVGEGMLAPAMPSTTARGAAIFVPLVKSVSAAAGSYPEDEATRHRLGAYLIQSQLQSSAHSSAIFLTASAQNLLCLQLAEALGLTLGNHFAIWSQGAIVPALMGTVATPLLVYKLLPPTVTATPEAPAQAAARLEQLGDLTQDETVMMAAVGMALTLWVFGDQLGVPPVAGAMLAVAVLLAFGVLDWKTDCLKGTPQAFDTLMWFQVLISMSLALQGHGVIAAFSDGASGLLGPLHLPWPALFAALHGLFFAAHYLFASQTAHIGALYTAFLSLMLAGGVPPTLAAMSLAYNVCLFGSLTHYASGQAAVYFGSGFLAMRELFFGGAVCGAFALGLWGTVGMAWWHVLGWW